MRAGSGGQDSAGQPLVPSHARYSSKAGLGAAPRSSKRQRQAEEEYVSDSGSAGYYTAMPMQVQNAIASRPLLDGRYRLLKHLNSTGMTETFRARDVTTWLPAGLSKYTVRVYSGAAPGETTPALKRVQQEGKRLMQLQASSEGQMRFSPRFHDVVFELPQPALVFEDLGKDLAHVTRATRLRQALPPETLCDLGVQMLRCLCFAHQHGFVVRNVRPSTFRFLRTKQRLVAKQQRQDLVLADLSVAEEFMTRFMSHVPPATGIMLHPANLAWLSVRALEGARQERADDLESLILVVVYLFNGRRTWGPKRPASGWSSRVHRQQAHHQDMNDRTPEELCRGAPPQIAQALRYIRSLEHGTAPDYDKVKNMFRAAGRWRLQEPEWWGQHLQRAVPSSSEDSDGEATGALGLLMSRVHGKDQKADEPPPPPQELQWCSLHGFLWFELPESIRERVSDLITLRIAAESINAARGRSDMVLESLAEKSSLTLQRISYSLQSRLEKKAKGEVLRLEARGARQAAARSELAVDLTLAAQSEFLAQLNRPALSSSRNVARSDISALLRVEAELTPAAAEAVAPTVLARLSGCTRNMLKHWMQMTVLLRLGTQREVWIESIASHFPSLVPLAFHPGRYQHPPLGHLELLLRRSAKRSSSKDNYLTLLSSGGMVSEWWHTPDRKHHITNHIGLLTDWSLSLPSGLYASITKALGEAGVWGQTLVDCSARLVPGAVKARRYQAVPCACVLAAAVAAAVAEPRAALSDPSVEPVSGVHAELLKNLAAVNASNPDSSIRSGEAVAIDSNRSIPEEVSSVPADSENLQALVNDGPQVDV
eukprot:Hpha_TRINITY_DN16745_c2_g10::TRINITY_DN16745_c2_g10_i1::g.77639::m.77639